MTVVGVPFPQATSTTTEGSANELVNGNATDGASEQIAVNIDSSTPVSPAGTDTETEAGETVQPANDAPSSDDDSAPETTSDEGDAQNPADLSDATDNSEDRVVLTAYCTDAGVAIRDSIELGMTPEQVLEIVGKPIETSASGTYWDYGRSGRTPEIQFNAVMAGGVLAPSAVADYDTDTRGCGEREIAFVDAANALALEGPLGDNTNEIPTCFDAGIRIQAFVTYGMSPEDVRRIVGKPIETSASGTYWDYSEYSSGPEVNFTAMFIANGLVPRSVADFDSDTSSCQ